jgi:hypothetical protein
MELRHIRVSFKQIKQTGQQLNYSLWRPARLTTITMPTIQSLMQFINSHQ